MEFKEIMVHLDGTPTGAKPRLRHDPDCSHFEWGDGTVLGTPQLATEEQMQALASFYTRPLHNWREIEIGVIRPAFKLNYPAN